MQSGYLSIGDVGRCTGFNPSTIRFYEKAGLLPKPVRIGGKRCYSDAILDRLTLVEYAKNSGFKLDEIRSLFYGFREGIPISARWQQLAKSKIAELDTQMRQIEAMKILLERALRCRCIDPDECGQAMRRRRAKANTTGQRP